MSFITGCYFKIWI